MGAAMAANISPEVDDSDGRRAMWESIRAAASTALPAPAEITSCDA